ncbi:hypothetical protein LCGC14_2584040, partial [marine sediment metagenome]
MPSEDFEVIGTSEYSIVEFTPGEIMGSWEDIMSRDFGLSLSALLLYAQATNLQQRVFARLITNLRRNSCLLYHVKDTKFPLYPSEPTIQGFLAAA